MANYPKYQGQRMIKEDEYAYLQELIESHEDPSADWGGASYTAGTGIDITDGEISVNYGTGLTVDDETLIIDTIAIATKTDLEDYELKADAFSGSYTDLTDKPDLSIYAQSANLATVATTGDYDDLLNKPSIPAAQVQSNWNESDTTSKAYIQNKPTIPTTATSNSTVTPSTVQLTFTYSDNTTETITLMTGASVTTTTTLS